MNCVIEFEEDFMPETAHKGINVKIIDIKDNIILERVIDNFYKRYDVVDIKFGVINRISGWKDFNADIKYSVMIIFKERDDK